MGLFAALLAAVGVGAEAGAGAGAAGAAGAGAGAGAAGAAGAGAAGTVGTAAGTAATAAGGAGGATATGAVTGATAGATAGGASMGLSQSLQSLGGAAAGGEAALGVGTVLAEPTAAAVPAAGGFEAGTFGAYLSEAAPTGADLGFVDLEPIAGSAAPSPTTQVPASLADAGGGASPQIAMEQSAIHGPEPGLPQSKPPKIPTSFNYMEILGMFMQNKGTTPPPPESLQRPMPQPSARYTFQDFLSEGDSQREDDEYVQSLLS